MWLYICSNQAIASQNINRLNVMGRDAFTLPTRMTLLPLQLVGEHGLGNNKVNFISLTPGTTFNLRSSTGVSPERALLYHLLKDMVEPRKGLYNLLQVGAGVDSWKWAVEQTPFEEVDQKLIDDFRSECAKGDLLDELSELCGLFHKRRCSYPQTMVERRNPTIARLRSRLAHVCVDALEPDLIILDEFQRFTELLHGDHDAAMLARELFDYTDREGNAAAHPASLRNALPDADFIRRHGIRGGSLPRIPRDSLLPVRTATWTGAGSGSETGDRSISSRNVVFAGCRGKSPRTKIVDRRNGCKPSLRGQNASPAPVTAMPWSRSGA